MSVCLVIGEWDTINISDKLGNRIKTWWGALSMLYMFFIYLFIKK
jgi:hypothetical protein